jgi:hypothetical protein
MFIYLRINVDKQARGDICEIYIYIYMCVCVCVCTSAYGHVDIYA